MADVAVLELDGNSVRLHARALRAQSEAKTWGVQVAAPANAVFHVFNTFPGPFPPETAQTIAENMVKNVGDTAAKIYISFDAYDPTTGTWVNALRSVTADPVAPGGCAKMDFAAGFGGVSACACTADPGVISINTPSTPGTYYFGMKCWAEGEAEPSYPAVGALGLQEGEEGGGTPIDLSVLFPRLVGGELTPRLSCLLGEPESFVACLFPRLRALIGEV